MQSGDGWSAFGASVGVEALVMLVVEATERDIASIRGRAPDLADSALAASALALARELDDAGNSATSKSMCARALLDTLDRLRELTPPKREADKVDDLGERRAKRLAGGAAPAG